MRTDKHVCVRGKGIQFRFGNDAYTLGTHRVIELTVMNELAQTIDAVSSAFRGLFEKCDGTAHAGAEHAWQR